ncbi:fluoride efflux transporter CrcB [Arthrobacter psychrolactophilus]
MKPALIQSLILVGLGGSLGAAAREGLVLAIPNNGVLPWAILLANIVGALILGLLLSALTRHASHHPSPTPPSHGGMLPRRRSLQLLLGTGFCGGFTTYSTLAVGIVSLSGTSISGRKHGHRLWPGHRHPRRRGHLARHGVGQPLMTPWVFITLAAAGGLGAISRFLLDGAIGRRFQTAFPWATFSINVSGSFALGLLTALAAGQLVSTEWALILGTGFLGGYTTFSTNSYETLRLLQEKRYVASLANALGTLLASVAAAALGFWLGALI